MILAVFSVSLKYLDMIVTLISKQIYNVSSLVGRGLGGWAILVLAHY
jgi:hypothetical protein